VQQKCAKRNWSKGAARPFFLRISTTESAPKGEGLTRSHKTSPSGKSAELKAGQGCVTCVNKRVERTQYS